MKERKEIRRVGITEKWKETGENIIRSSEIKNKRGIMEKKEGILKQRN